MNNFKKYFLALVIVSSIAYLTIIISKPETISAKYLPESKSTQHFSALLNKDATLEIMSKHPNKTDEKFGVDVQNQNTKNSKVELTLQFAPKTEGISERRASVKGSIFIGNRAFGYAGTGIFEPFITPDTQEVIYVGNLDGELLGVNMDKAEPDYKEYDGNNSPWFVTFNPSSGQLHVAASVGFQEYSGHLFFGENMMSKEYWDALEKQIDERTNQQFIFK